jgi:predicted nucleic acid-binding protein
MAGLFWPGAALRHKWLVTTTQREAEVRGRPFRVQPSRSNERTSDFEHLCLRDFCLRVKISAADCLAQMRRLPECRIEPLTDDIAESAGQFGNAFRGDPADRMIAATALVRGVPLVTQDEILHGTDYLKTIW